MITVMLVDDETATLRSLSRNIQWEELQLQPAGSFSNGQEALEQIKRKSPDILITDIVMPILTGLELAQYIYEQNLNVKIVFLSGHQEFEYAHQGIRYNVSNYLIKPCEKQQLNALLDDLAHECIREKKELLEKQRFEAIIDSSRPQLREKLLLDLLHGNLLPSDALAEKCDFLGIDRNLRYYVIASEVDDVKAQFQALHEKEKVLTTLYMSEAMSSTLPTTEGTALLQIGEGQHALLISESITQDIQASCNQIRMTFHSFTGLHVTYGIGGGAVPLEELGNAYEKAKETLLYKYLAGKDTVICYEDISVSAPMEVHLSNTFSLQSQIIRAVKSGAFEELEPLCENLFINWEKTNPTLTKSLIIQFVGALSSQLLEMGESLTELFGDENIVFEKVLRFETIFDVKLWLTQLLQYISNHIREKKQRSVHRLAQKAADYIEEHYSENVTVNTLAGQVYLSPGYLMTIFKREMGTSINSYLTAKRIEHAKELLLEDRLKIYEIAQKVGYPNTTFFSSTFRNHVGLSPKQFKERYLGAIGGQEASDS